MIDGARPDGDLVASSDGTTVYGMTSLGGAGTPFGGVVFAKSISAPEPTSAEMLIAAAAAAVLLVRPRRARRSWQKRDPGGLAVGDCPGEAICGFEPWRSAGFFVDGLGIGERRESKTGTGLTSDRKPQTLAGMESLRFSPRALLPLAIFLTVLPLMSGAEEPGGNRIKNANFEEGATGWQLINFGKTGTMAMDQAELHEGNPTLRIESLGQLSFVRQTVTVKPHTTYLFSAYVKVKDVHEDGGAGIAGAVLMEGQSQYGSQGVYGTSDWQKVTTQVNTEDKSVMPVGPGMGWWASKIFGTGWFSDLSFTEMERDVPRDNQGSEANQITNGNFEKETYGWELVNFGKGGTIEVDPAELHDGKPTLRVEASDAMTFARQIVTVKPHTTYRLSGFIKVKDVQENGGGGDAGASLIVGGTRIKTQAVRGTNDWQEVSVEFNSEKNIAIRVGAAVGFYGRNVTGTAWVSDMTLAEAKRDHRPRAPHELDFFTRPITASIPGQ
jgi:hypothetical protein